MGTLFGVAGKRDLERLQEGLDELIQDLWRMPRLAGFQRGFQPPVDCYRRDDPPELHVVVELPGVDPADVRLAIEGRILHLAGERRRPAADCRLSYHRLELEYGPFRRRVPLPEEVDVKAARATYERGMLTVVLPIAARPAAPERFSIRVQARR